MTDSHWPAEAATRLDKFLASSRAPRLSRQGRDGARTRPRLPQRGGNGAERCRTHADAGRPGARLARSSRQRTEDRPPRPQRRSGHGVLRHGGDRREQTGRSSLRAARAERGRTVGLRRLEAYYRSHGKRKPFPVHRIESGHLGTGRLRQGFKRPAGAERPVPAAGAAARVPGPSSTDFRIRSRARGATISVWDRKALIQKQTHPRDPQGIEAASDYRVLEAFAEASLVEVRLQTGKRNQIRIQARLRGHTLVGERRYVFGPDSLRPIPFKRHALHARRLAFRHPGDGRELSFEAPLPADLAGLLDLLRDE